MLNWAVSDECEMGVEFLELLLDHGAVPMIQVGGYMTPQLLCALAGRLDQFETIVRHPKCPIGIRVEALLVFGATRVDTGIMGELWRS